MIRVGRALVTLTIGLGIVACTVQKAPDEAVIAVDVNSKSGRVKDLVLGLPLRLVAHGTPPFSVKTQEGAVATWRGAHVAVGGDAAAVTITPSVADTAPRVNDAVVVSFTDPSTQVQHVLPTVVIGTPTSAQTDTESIENADFSTWASGQSPLPKGWFLAGSAHSFFVEPVLDATGGIRLGVAEQIGAPRSQVISEVLAQDVSLPSPTLNVRFRTYDDCIFHSIGAVIQPSSVVGIGVKDAAGRRVVFCLSSRRVSQLVRTQTGSTVYVMVPGKLGDWNNLRIDLTSVWPDFAAANANRHVELEVVAAMLPIASPHAWTMIDVASFGTISRNRP